MSEVTIDSIGPSGLTLSLPDDTTCIQPRLSAGRPHVVHDRHTANIP